MKNLLEKSGFSLISQCSCGGVYQRKYGKHKKFPSIKIVIFPNARKFDILKDDVRIAKGKEEIFEQKLIENGIIKIAESAQTAPPQKTEEPEQGISEQQADN